MKSMPWSDDNIPGFGLYLEGGKGGRFPFKRTEIDLKSEVKIHLSYEQARTIITSLWLWLPPDERPIPRG